MTRTYQAPVHKSGTTICSGSTTGTTDGRASQQFDWCLLAKAEKTARGMDLLMKVCRDDTLGGSLTFQTSRESDLVVRDPEGNEVWRWSTGHASRTDHHALATPAGGCWLWTVPWTQVDRRGARLGSGTYTLTGTTDADELQTTNYAEASFTI